ncbi:hypothetical protein [Spongiimicrobium salis]|uniref:hypothetical protein n=1 Tax=Spongiimicrobium salis TaxID=1667022 RepID=UPI00374D0F6C
MSIFLRSLIFIMPDFILNKPNINVWISTISGMLIVVILDFVFSKKNRKRIILENTFEYYLNLKSKRFYDSLIDKLYGIRGEKKDLGFSHYLKNIYHLKTVLGNRQMKYGFSKLSSFKLKSKTIQWYIVSVLIGVYLFYRLNDLMEKELMELDLGFIVLGRNGFFSFWAFFWYFSRKLAILLPLCIWFSISRNWWKYAILSPIFLYTYQIWEIFQGLDSLEGWENLRALPILAVVLLALIFISRTMRYESKIMDVQEQIVDEIEELLQKQQDENRVQQDKYALERLRVEVASNEAKQKQLDDLLSLKQRLEDELLEK